VCSSSSLVRRGARPNERRHLTPPSVASPSPRATTPTPSTAQHALDGVILDSPLHTPTRQAHLLPQTRSCGNTGPPAPSTSTGARERGGLDYSDGVAGDGGEPALEWVPCKRCWLSISAVTSMVFITRPLEFHSDYVRPP